MSNATHSILSVVFAVSGLLLSGSALARAEAPAAAFRRFALIASSNDGGADRVRLRFADSDAQTMAEVLRNLGGLRAEDMVLLNGATRQSLESSFEHLRAALANAEPEKQRRELFIYYSGHSDETGLLLGGERVSYDDLRRWLQSTDADVRIAVLDSCASGALIRLRGGARRPSFLSDVSVDARGHAFLTASSADEAAQESDRIGAAFFTHYLVSGLRGAADANGDGRVTLNEAYQFAYSETLGRTEQTAAGAQHPAYDIQLAGTGDLVLTDLRATGASLVLAQDVQGRAYVRDAAGRLLVEVRKQPAHPIALGLPPGQYRVALDRDGRHFEAQAALMTGAKTELAMQEFTATTALITAARGDLRVATEQPVGKTESSGFIDTAIGKDTLIGQTRELGGYAGLGFRYSELGDTDGFMAMLEAALLINRRLALGVAAGGGFSGPIDAERNRIAGGFAGVVTRYSFLFDSPASFSLGAIAGAGGFELEEDIDDKVDDDPSDAVFVFEPQLTGDLDVTRFARIGVDFGYRLVAGADAIATQDLRGITGGFHVQLGWF
jgi:hypothetical protein